MHLQALKYPSTVMGFLKTQSPLKVYEPHSSHGCGFGLEAPKGTPRANSSRG